MRAALALLLLTPVLVQAQDRAQRLTAIAQGVSASVADLEKRMLTPDGDPSIRDLPNAALAELITTKNITEPELLLRAEFAQQNMNQASPDFGNLPWQIGHPEIHDANAIEFGMQSVGPIWLGHKLPADFKRELLPNLKAALAAIRRHEVEVKYTNIFLMKTVNLILIGEAIGDPDAAAQGYAQLDQWMAYTRHTGIHEFDSPTYYAPDLSSLAMGWRYAARPEAKAKFKSCIDYFWRDIAANYFPPRATLSGPHSRDYDFLSGTGDLDIYLYAEGLRPSQDLKKLNLEKALLLEAEAALPPPDLKLAHMPVKVVTSHWDTTPHSQRYNYITPDFAIGSTSGDYGPQDKLFSIELPNSVISIVPDTLDSPYGLAKAKGSDGHAKPHHIQIHLQSVQHKGAALLMLDLDPRKEKDIQSLATNILLPANADQLVLNGKPVSAAADLNQPAGPDCVIGVKQGNAGVALRLFAVDGCAGQVPAVILKADPDGFAKGAIRLAIYHYRGATATLTDAHARVAVLVIAAHCATNSEFAALLTEASKTTITNDTPRGFWKIKAVLPDVTLEATRDMTNRFTLDQRVNGRDFLTMPSSALALSLNGADLSLK